MASEASRAERWRCAGGAGSEAGSKAGSKAAVGRVSGGGWKDPGSRSKLLDTEFVPWYSVFLTPFSQVCLGTRSATGSENVAIFASVVKTAKLRGCETLEIFEALPTEPPETAHEILFPAAARAG